MATTPIPVKMENAVSQSKGPPAKIPFSVLMP